MLKFTIQGIQIIIGKLNEHQGYWCPDSLHHCSTINNITDYTRHPCDPLGWTSTHCDISQQINDINGHAGGHIILARLGQVVQINNYHLPEPYSLGFLKWFSLKGINLGPRLSKTPQLSCDIFIPANYIVLLSSPDRVDQFCQAIYLINTREMWQLLLTAKAISFTHKVMLWEENGHKWFITFQTLHNVSSHPLCRMHEGWLETLWCVSQCLWHITTNWSTVLITLPNIIPHITIWISCTKG